MLEHLIDNYGYIAIVIGTFLEGETVLILGGIAAKLDYLKLPWVIFYAFIGTLCGDQLFFLLGRFHGQSLLNKRPSWQKRVEKVNRIIEQHPTLIILGFRFLYGLRNITPFVLGMSQIAIIKFAILNIISAALWAVIIGSLGYAFGHGLELMLGDIKRYEVAILGITLISGVFIWFIHQFRDSKQQK